MGVCSDCESFVEGGTVPEGKNGACIRSEEGLRGGTVTYSRPVSKSDSCEKFVEKKGCLEIGD